MGSSREPQGFLFVELERASSKSCRGRSGCWCQGREGDEKQLWAFRLRMLGAGCWMLDAGRRMPSHQVRSEKVTWKDAIWEEDFEVSVDWFTKHLLLSLEGESSYILFLSELLPLTFYSANMSYWMTFPCHAHFFTNPNRWPQARKSECGFSIKLSDCRTECTVSEEGLTSRSSYERRDYFNRKVSLPL